LIARGRDAADVAVSNSFGPNTLKRFKVWTDEVTGALPESNAPLGEAAWVRRRERLALRVPAVIGR